MCRVPEALHAVATSQRCKPPGAAGAANDPGNPRLPAAENNGQTERASGLLDVFRRECMSADIYVRANESFTCRESTGADCC